MSSPPRSGRRGKLLLLAGVVGLLAATDVLIYVLAQARYQPPPPLVRAVAKGPLARTVAEILYDPLTDDDPERLIQILYNKEEYGNGAIRAKAARRLGVLRSQAALPVLTEMLNDTTAFSSPDIRQACATALGTIGDPGAVPALNEALRLGTQQAIAALQAIGTAEAVGVLASVLQDFSRGKTSIPADARDAMARTIAHSLGTLDDPSAVPALTTAMRHGTRPAISALGRIGTPAAIDALTGYLGDLARRSDSHDVQRAIAQALGSAKDRRAVPALVALLEQRNGGDPQKDPAFAAVHALAAIRDPHAVPALIALDRGPAALKSEMAVALQQILLHNRTVVTKLTESFDDPTNPHGWTLEEGVYRSVRLTDGRLSVFSSRIGERVETYPTHRWTGDWIASVRLRFRKGSGTPHGMLLFGQHENRWYTTTLGRYHPKSGEPVWSVTVVRISGEHEDQVLHQPVSHRSGWNTLTVRHIDTIVSVLLNGAYVGSFQAEAADALDGRIGLGAANDNHVVYDDFRVETAAGERVLAAVHAPEPIAATPPVRPRGPAFPLRYIVSRRAPVYTRPQSDARIVAWVQSEMRICVVAQSGDWLEVRSTRGRPPGFIQQKHMLSTRTPCKK